MLSQSHRLVLKVRRNLRRLISPLILSSVFLSGCGKSETSTEPTATPGAIAIGTGNGQTGVVATTLTVPLSVTVKDVTGKLMANATVSWDVSTGGGATSSATTRTDSRGITQVTWTLGTSAGTASVTAQVGGVNPATFTATVLPGPIAVVVALPDVLNLGVGDTITVAATTRDQYGNEITGSALAFSTPDGTIANVNANGFLTATAIGIARIIVGVGSKADTIPVTVSAAGASPCGTLAVTTMLVGQVITPTTVGSSARICLTGAAANGEFGLVAFSSSSVFATTTPFDVYGLGLVTPTAPILASAISTPPSFDLGVAMLTVPITLQLDRSAELSRRELERKELAPLLNVAR